MAKIIGIGNALMDVLVPVTDEELRQTGLRKGDMTLVDGAIATPALEDRNRERVMATGGSASNTIMGLALLGAQTAFVGQVEDDEMGRAYVTGLQERGTEWLGDRFSQTCQMQTKAADVGTGVAYTFVTPDGERTFATYLGAAARVTEVGMAQLEQAEIRPGEVVYVEGYLVPANPGFVLEAMRYAKSRGALVALDLASAALVESNHTLMEEVLTLVDICFANESEAEAYGGSTDSGENARRLAQVVQTAVVKLGKRGAMCVWSADTDGGNAALQSVEVASHNPKPLDTTAAGDFFAAGFLFAYTRARANDACASAHVLKQCVELGNRMAGEVIQVYGTQVRRENIRRLAQSL